MSGTNPASLELFAAEVPKAIFSCRLLDRADIGDDEKCPLLLPYVHYRALRTPMDTLIELETLRVILRTADLLCQKSGVLASDRDTRRKHIKSLCDLSIALRPIRKWWNNGAVRWHNNKYEDEPETHLFVAAVYTNSDSLVRQMLGPISERSDTRVFSSVFGSSYSAASQQGNRELLLLLLERLYRPDGRANLWHFSAKSQAAMIAVQRGHLDAGSLFLSTESFKPSTGVIRFLRYPACMNAGKTTTYFRCSIPRIWSSSAVTWSFWRILWVKITSRIIYIYVCSPGIPLMVMLKWSDIW